MAKKTPSGRPTAEPATSGGATRKAAGGVAIHGTMAAGGHVVGGDMTILVGTSSASQPAPLSPAITAYVTWLRTQPMGLSLIGVAGGDMPLALDQVYVPLSLQHGRTGPPRRERARDAAFAECRDNFELTDLLVRIGTFRHAILLGRAGTGKTTALRKLVQQCLPSTDASSESGPGTIHLPPGYVPLLVFLRRVTDADLDRPLAAFLRDQLEKTSEGELSSATLDALFSPEHGRLLVLLDGLDEIADPIRRTKFCEHLTQQLHQEGCKHLRIVMTSRPAGYEPNMGRLGQHFAEVSIEPLGPEQVPRLVHRWFSEAARCLGDRYPESRATDQATRLIGELEQSKFGRDLRVMFSTPLFLTLLCVVVQQGKAMPSSRAIFYRECLHVLLERWHLGKDSEFGTAAAAPAEVRISAERAIDLLRPIAYALHADGKREEWDQDDLVDQIGDRLPKVGLRVEDADKVLAWLRDTATVILEFGEGKLGFFHFNVQEYLAALHIESEGGELLRKLSQEFKKDWWHETARLVVSIGGKQVFAALIGPLLDGPEILDPTSWKVLRECFLLARELDLELVLDRLDGREGSQEPERLIALLGLMRGLDHARLDPRFAASARRLAERTDSEDVKTAALIAVNNVQVATVAATEWDVAVLALDADDAAAQELEERIKLKVWRGGRYPAVDRAKLVESVSVVVLLIGLAPWPTTAGKLKVIRKMCRMVGVFAPGAAASKPDIVLDGALDCRAGWDDAEIAKLLRPQATGPIEREAFVESITGMRLVWVPGGQFNMGSEGLGEDSLPVHSVRLSRYWIGETPVTNRQYEVFLKARPGQRKPRLWNHADYSDPEQPVIAVSWDDVMAFCAWLSDETGLQCYGSVYLRDLVPV